MTPTYPHSWRRPVAGAVLVAMGLSCYRWDPVPVPPEVLPPGEYRFTLLDDSRLALLNPRFEGDSIVGLHRDAKSSAVRTGAVARASVRRIETPDREARSELRWNNVFDARPTGSEIRLRMRDSAMVNISKARFDGDSIRGYLGVEYVATSSTRSRRRGSTIPVAYALSDVAAIEAKRVDRNNVFAIAFSLTIVSLFVACLETECRHWRSP